MPLAGSPLTWTYLAEGYPESFNIVIIGPAEEVDEALKLAIHIGIAEEYDEVFPINRERVIAVIRSGRISFVEEIRIEYGAHGRTVKRA